MKTIQPIATIKNDYVVKFGIPRQSGVVNENLSTIIFEQKYRNFDAIKELEHYTSIWLIWDFSANENDPDSFVPTVRPPKLGGNKRIGVFASRSPFRPNGLGLSCVDIVEIKIDEKNGPVIVVSGADLLCGTPIYDIKPYVPYSDCRTYASNGLSVPPDKDNHLKVVWPEEADFIIKRTDRWVLEKILSIDPRPAYHNDKDRVYSFEYGSYKISFKVDDDVLTVCALSKNVVT